MKKTPGESAIATCPSCDTKIRFEEPPHLGQTIDCPECGDTLEVVRRNPLELDWAFDSDAKSFDDDVDEDEELLGNDEDWYDDGDGDDDDKW